MSQQPFRFIHAADLHLERPLTGVPEVPDVLRSAFVEAPYLAAQRVFDVAVAEQADFVVLSGDVLDAELTGPRGPLFLAEQFERLCRRGIGVYWAGGQVDPASAWPAAIRLSDNVHVFQGRAQERLHQRGGEPLARLLGAAAQRGGKVRVSDFKHEPSELFTIAVAHGHADAESLAKCHAPYVHYWALGGRHGRHSPCEGPVVAHYSGTTQGRDPGETGAHGCTLVEVDADGACRLRPLATDALGWRRERVVATPDMTHDELGRAMAEKLLALVASAAGLNLLVLWEVSGSGPLLSQLRGGTLADELLASLRGRFAQCESAAWSVSIDVAADAVLPAEWFERQDLLGDFLQAVSEAQAAPAASAQGRLDITACLGSRADGVWAEALALDDEATRRRVLRRAAALGADLLTAGEPHSRLRKETLP